VDEEAPGWPASWQEVPSRSQTSTVEVDQVEPLRPVGPGTAVADRPAFLEPRPARSHLATTCPYFRRQTAEGTLGRPVEMPDSINRCAAYGEPLAQSLRQQELVCLTTRHVDCPRYLHAAAPTHPAPKARRVTRAVLAAIGILVASAAASVAFVVIRGGISLPSAAAPGGAVEAATGTPAATVVAVVATPSPTPAVTPTPTASPSPASEATPAPTPRPSSDRYALLVPCADQPDCYVYTVRRGDTLTGIAKYFGTTLARVRELNPWTLKKGLEVGQQIILPTPTR
jgi:LysM repeat protein